MNPTQTNPNDYKVVSFHNFTDFGFTPEMGCMYNSVAINGNQGGPGINKGETVVLPYHIAHQLALNLAKVALSREAPATDPTGIPTGVPLWDTEKLNKIKNSYLEDLYTEEKPVAMTETDKLLQRFEEYKKMNDERFSELAGKPVNTAPIVEKEPEPKLTEKKEALSYRDKAEVIEELTKRGITHDKRKNKEELEKLLA